MRSPITRALLLVGGAGTRLRPLTNLRPKALIPLLDQPLLSYELALLARHGITDVVLAVGYRADALRTVLGDGSAWGVALTYVEEATPLGTAGAIKHVARCFDAPFIAMNGDLVYDVDVGAVAAAHLRAAATVTFCLRRVTDIRRYGLIRCDDTGAVTEFLEKQDVDRAGANTVNSGLYVMSPAVFDYIPAGREFSNETELFPALLAAGEPLLGMTPPADGYWADVGTPQAYLEANRDLLAGAVSWTGPAVAAAARVAARARLIAPVHIAPDVAIAADATVGPHVTLGRGCAVGRGAHLTDAVCWEGVTVAAGDVVAHTILAPDARVLAATGADGAGVPPSPAVNEGGLSVL